MRNLSSALIAILFVTVLGGLQSCGNDKSKLLAKTWRLQNLEYTREVPEELKPVVNAAIEQMRQNFSITYMADGTYITRQGAQEMKGKWKLNFNSGSITSTDDNGTTQTYKIKQLTEENFTFEAVMDGEKVIFVLIPAKTQQ